MGGSHSQETATPSVQECLAVLANSESSLEQRRCAFQTAQSELVPPVDPKVYAAELRRVFALRFEPWAVAGTEYIPSGSTTLSEHHLADRVRGLIFGAALGDAMGLSTEFMSRDEVSKHYPENHEFRPSAPVYPDTHRMMFAKADWTDDSDQLVLILQTLLEHGGRYDISFNAKLVEWKEHGFEGLGDQGGAGLGQHTKNVLQQPDFLTEAFTAADREWKKRGCKLASNGAVMRTAVTGIPQFWDAQAVKTNTLEFCKCTHADPRCVASCIVISECVRLMLQGADRQDEHTSLELVEQIIEQATLLAEQYLDEYEVSISDADVALLKSDLTAWKVEARRYAHIDTIDALELDEPRTIGYTFKCMGCALWALRSSVDNPQPFVSTITRIIRAGGDADTNAAVAGALVGARVGYECLPQDYIAELPYVVWLEAWVQKILWMLRLPVVRALPKEEP